MDIKALTKIGTQVFQGCSSLKYVHAGNGASTNIAGSNIFRSLSGVTLELDNSFTLGTYGLSYALGSATGIDLIINNTAPYTVRKNDYHLMGALTSLKSLTINGPVAAVEGASFDGCTNLERVVLGGGSDLTIGMSAFSGCTKLKTVTIGDNCNLTIQGYSFGNCTSLETVTIGGNVVSGYANAFGDSHAFELIFTNDATIGEKAFNQVENLNKVTFRGNATLGAYAFGATDVSRLVFEGQNNSLGANAFAYCEKLTAVDMAYKGAGTLEIGEGAFNHAGLTSFTYGDDAAASTVSIGEGAFLYDTALETVELKAKLQGDIGATAFQFDNALQSFKITGAGDPIAIGDKAFNECGALKTFEPGSPVKEFGKSCFEKAGLEALTVETANAVIDENAFDSTPGLKKLVFNGTVSTVESAAIGSASKPSGVETLVFNGSVGEVKGAAATLSDSGFVYVGAGEGTTVGSNAFGESQDAVVYFNMPKSKVTGGDSLAQNAKGNVHYADTLPEEIYVDPTLTVDDSTEQDGSKEHPFASFDRIAALIGEQAGFQAAAEAAGMADLNLPFGNYTSDYAYTLHVVGAGAEIPNNALKDDTHLAAVVFEGADVVIGNSAFTGCIANLRAMELLGSVATVEAGAFSGASETEETIVYFAKREGGTTVAGGAFPSNEKLSAYFNLPKASVTGSDGIGCTAYFNAEPINPFYVNLEKENGDGSEKAPFNTFEAASAHVQGTGSDYGLNDKLAAVGAPNPVSFDVAVPEGGFTMIIKANNENVTVPADAFKDCVNLTGVQQSTGFKTLTIEPYAFTGSGLKQLELMRYVTIEEGAFMGIDTLESVKISDAGTVKIGKDAFKGNASLTTLDLTENPSGGSLTIGESAFEGTGLTGNLVLGQEGNTGYGKITIDKAAFKGLTGITGLEIYRVGDFDIGESAFEGCSALASVKVAYSGTSGYRYNNGKIGEAAFKDCAALTHVEMDIECLKSVEKDAFANDAKLTEALFINTTADIKAGAFAGATGIKTVRIDDLGNGACDVADGAFDSTLRADNLVIAGKKPFLRNDDFAGFKNFKNLIYTGTEDDGFYSLPDGGNFEVIYLGAGYGLEENDIKDFEKCLPKLAKLQAVYIAHDYATVGEENALRIVKAAGNAKVHFLNEQRAPGVYFASTGSTKADGADGTKAKPFNNFEDLKQGYIEARGQEQGDETVITDEVIGPLLTAAYGDAGITKTPETFTCTIKGDVVAYVLDEVEVSDTQTWDGDLSKSQAGGGNATQLSGALEIYRDPDYKGALVKVTGTLTLTNVVLDGNNKVASGVNSAMIVVTSPDSLYIKDGTELRNNDHSEATYPNGGGAVLAINGTVHMEGGKISGNRAPIFGGGIHMNGGTLTMSGGVIEDNEVFQAHGDKASGGGISLMNGATMELTGGKIQNNKSTGDYSHRSVGGGISVGCPIATDSGSFHKGTLTMSGESTISGNEAFGEGGGIYIEGDCTADITGGSITGNESKDGLFGGGIYVNGGRYVKVADGKAISTGDGILKLTRVVVKSNTAGLEGGGMAACPTSTSTIHVGNGSAIYSNSGDDLYVEHSDISGPMVAYIAAYMFDGTAYEWKDASGKKVLEGEVAKRTSTIALTAGNSGPASGSVLISGNTAAKHGGGIGSNGTVIIGTEPSPETLKWKPEAKKLVKDRNMREGETFTFTVFQEFPSAPYYSDGAVKTDYGPDKVVGTGSVTLAKDGTPKEINFTEINLGTITKSDLGKNFVYLVVEDPVADDSVIADTLIYYAYTLTIGEGKNGKMERYLKKVEKGTCIYDSENGYTFFNARYNSKTGEIEDDGGMWNRKRTVIEPADAVFTNILNDCEISVDKTWLNFDGSTTPPTGAKVTFELLADGKVLTPANTIELDGTVDEGLTATSEKGEFAAWKATWKKLPIYREGHEGEEDQRIAYTVKETEVTVPGTSYTSPALTTPVEVAEGEPATIQNKQETDDLTISKGVESDVTADKNQEFEFNVALTSTPAITHTFNTNKAGVTVEFKDNETAKPIMLKDGESLTIVGLPQGVAYTVTETTPAEFDMTSEGDTGTIGKDPSTAAFTNTRKTGERTVYGEATVNKVDGSDNSALPGATFVLYADEAQTQEIYTYTSDEKGAFKISTDDKSLEGRLPGVGESVTYYLMETEASKGYRLEGEPRKVVISASLKHAIENDVYTAITTYAITIEGKAALTVPNPPITDEKVEHSHVTVNKQDDSGVALKGAEFTLYSGETAITTFGGANVDRFTINTNDAKLASYLPKTDESTTLTLKETKAPTGYQLSGDEYSVVIKKTVVTDWNTGHTALVTTTTYNITIDGKTSLGVKNKPAPTPTATPTPTPTPTPEPARRRREPRAYPGSPDRHRGQQGLERR